MTKHVENSQPEEVSSQHVADEEDLSVGGTGLQDLPARPVRGPAENGPQPGAPAELSDRRGRTRAVRGDPIDSDLDETRVELEARFEQRSFHVGPLPSPETLDAYERVHPGAAERIMRVMERTVYAEEDRRDAAMDAAVKTTTRGQLFAIGLAAVLVVAAIVFLWREQTVAGAILLGVPAVMLVKTFWTSSTSDGQQDTSPE